MAWWQPSTWFPKKEEPKQTITTTPIPQKSVPAPYDVIVQTPTGYVSKTYPSQSAYTSSGGGGQPQTPQQIVEEVKAKETFKTTADTGTGFNPATRVQEGKKEFTAQKIQASQDKNYSLNNISGLNRVAMARGTATTGLIPTGNVPASSTETKFNKAGFYIKDFLVGETGKQFVGVGGFLGLPYITATQIKTGLGQGNIPMKVLGEVIPTTPLGVASFVAIPKIYSSLPTAIKLGVGGTFTYLGTKTALNPNLPPEKRIVGGIVGGLSALGMKQEISPYVSGTTARFFSRNFKPIVTEEINIGGQIKSAEFIKGIKSESNLKSPFDIGLIKPSDIPTGNQPAFVSTAYGFTKEYQASYIGKQGTIVTSAKNLISGTNIISKAKNLITGTVPIKTDVSPLGIFATPYDIQTGIAQTRVSRLGTVELKDLFKIPQNAEISFGKQTPEIVLFEKGKITATGGGGTFRAIGKPSSELEVTAIGKIKDVTKVGITKIGLTAVNIYRGSLAGGKIIKAGVMDIDSPATSYVSPSGAYSKTLLGVFSIPKFKSPDYFKSSTSISKTSSSGIISVDPYIPSTPRGTSGISTGTSFSGGISYPPSVPNYPPSIPPSIPSIPPSTPSYPPSYPPSVPNYPPSIPPSIPIFNLGFDNKQTARIFKGKQRYKYVPSYEAFVFKIKGKQPKGLETGARVRPLTSGFSFSFNKPAFSFRGTGMPKINTNFKATKFKGFKLNKIRI